MNEEKSRVFAFRTYASSESLSRFLDDISDELTGYKYILHDKDGKKPHYHGVIKFEKRKRTSTVAKLFDSSLLNEEGNSAGTHIEKPQHINAAIRYLTHSTEQAKKDGKYQYSTEDIISFGEVTPDKEDSSVWFEMVNDYKDGISPFDFVKKYGYKAVSQYNNIKKIVADEVSFRGRFDRIVSARELLTFLERCDPVSGDPVPFQHDNLPHSYKRSARIKAGSTGVPRPAL